MKAAPLLLLAVPALSCGCAGEAEPPAGAPLATVEMEPEVSRRIEEALRATVDHPDSAEAWYRLGATLDAHKLVDRALPAYERARDLAPRDFKVVYNLAIATQLQGARPQEAIALLQGACAIDPAYPAGHLRLGEALTDAGRHGDARSAFEEALRLDPQLARARRGLGQALLALGRVAEAVVQLERTRAQAPGDGPTAALLAQAYGRKGDSEAADRAARAYPGEGDVLRFADPVRQAVISLDATASAIVRRARARIDAGQFDRAVADLLLVVEARPEDREARYLLGDAALHLGQPDLAREHLDEAVRLAPDLGWRVALAWAESGRIDEALAAFGRAEATAAPDATGYANWGIALTVHGDLEGAVARFRKAIGLQADYAFAHENLAAALERLGRTEEARTHRERAAELSRQ